MATGQRRYRVSGTDDLDDVHAFETDDRERAEEMRAIMAEDLEDVELLFADPLSNLEAEAGGEHKPAEKPE